MLILTRRISESVYIGDEVRLTVLGVRGTQVRIGINAPKDVPVHREEIYYKIKNEQGGGGASPGGGNAVADSAAGAGAGAAQYAQGGQGSPGSHDDRPEPGNVAPAAEKAPDEDEFLAPDEPDPHNA